MTLEERYLPQSHESFLNARTEYSCQYTVSDQVTASRHAKRYVGTKLDTKLDTARPAECPVIGMEQELRLGSSSSCYMLRLDLLTNNNEGNVNLPKKFSVLGKDKALELFI